MPIENIRIAVICWAMTFLLGGFIGIVSIWAYKRKKPMPFWSGVDIEPEEIADIPAYNRENRLMWVVYLVCMALGGVFSLFNIVIGIIMTVVVLILGTIVMIKAYKRIYNKYKSESGEYRTGF